VRLYLGAGLLVAVVLGGVWIVLALTFSRSGGSADAYTKSAACLRRDRSLTGDSADAARYRAAGLEALGIPGGRCVPSRCSTTRSRPSP
jgi:hypothetical protein